MPTKLFPGSAPVLPDQAQPPAAPATAKIQYASDAALARMPVRSFEQLSAGAKTVPRASVVREPRAYPAAPPRLPGAARPHFVVVEEDMQQALPLAGSAAQAVAPSPAPPLQAVAPEPVKPVPQRIAEVIEPPIAVLPPDDPLTIYPRLRRPPIRSRLSPSQRTQQHRATAARGTGESPYITYTVEPAASTQPDFHLLKPDSER